MSIIHVLREVITFISVDLIQGITICQHLHVRPELL